MNQYPDFLIIPYALIADDNIEPHAEKVYAVIYWYTQLGMNKCIASNKTLAKFLNTSPRTVQNSLDTLEKQGYIKRIYKDESKRNRKEIIPLISFKRASETLVTHERNLGDTSSEMAVTRIRKGNKKRDIATESQGPFLWNEYIKKMDNHKSRHIQVISFYFKKKKMRFDTLPKAQSAIRRHLRDAREVANFSDKEINDAYDIADREYRDKYTVGTLLKVLTR